MRSLIDKVFPVNVVAVRTHRSPMLNLIPGLKRVDQHTLNATIYDLAGGVRSGCCHKPAFPVEYLSLMAFHKILHLSSISPGIEDQMIEQVMRSLNELGAPDVQWLSDWHLIAFLGTCGLLSEDDTKVLVRIATA
ncbi:hypothetical protein BGW80DRAFT_668748 [Lactifluus volemus]|nr:hypothetical protein BGW80DRAFT_668748 [Lactifluus volemus]